MCLYSVSLSASLTFCPSVCFSHIISWLSLAMISDTWLKVSSKLPYGVSHLMSRCMINVITLLHVTFLRKFWWRNPRFFAGQDIMTAGLTGAMFGGLFCAGEILHRNLYNDLLAVRKQLKKEQWQDLTVFNTALHFNVVLKELNIHTWQYSYYSTVHSGTNRELCECMWFIEIFHYSFLARCC